MEHYLDSELFHMRAMVESTIRHLRVVAHGTDDEQAYTVRTVAALIADQLETRTAAIREAQLRRQFRGFC